MASNADTVRDLYAALSNGDVATFLAAMDDQIYWEEPASMPFENQRGPQAVAENILGPVTEQIEGFSGAQHEFVDGGDVVCVMGVYSGTGMETGIELKTAFVHVWRFGPNGKITGLRIYTDTHLWRQALGVD